MDPEIKNLLEENLRLSRENNEILLKVRKIQKWNQIWKIAYWVVIIAITFGSYFFIQPYLNSLLGYYTGIANDGASIKANISDYKNVESILDKFKK